MKKIRSIPRLFNFILLNDKYEAFLKHKGIKEHPEFARNNEIRMEKLEILRKKSLNTFPLNFLAIKNCVLVQNVIPQLLLEAISFGHLLVYQLISII